MSANQSTANPIQGLSASSESEVNKPLRQALAIARVLAGLTLVLIALGGYVRATGAGLSCPDWPLCFGRVVPPDFGSGVAQEMIHRVVASCVTLGFLYFLYLSVKARRQYPGLFKTALFIALLLGVQIVFGGLTVLMRLNPLVVTTHLFLGTLLFQTFAQLSLERSTPSSGEKRKSLPNISKGVRTACYLVTGLVLAQILVGGFVGSSGASMACPDAPLCYGQLMPPHGMGGAVHLQVGHRLLGFLLLAALFFLAFALRGRRSLQMHTFGMVFLVGVQISIGIANVNFGIPAFITILHLVVAQLILFGVVVLLRRAADLPPLVAPKLA